MTLMEMVIMDQLMAHPKDKRIAELEAELAALRAPEKINPRALYSRLVGKLMARWAELYPMTEWIDPETAVGRIADEARDSRG